MNFADIKIRVQKIFGDESGAQIDSADILRWANDAQIEIAKNTEGLDGPYTTPTLDGVAAYALPVDFLLVRRVTFDGYHLERKTAEQLDLVNPNRDVSTSTGKPVYYYTRSRSIYLYPVPGPVGTLKLTYVKRPADLVDDTSIPNLPVEMHEDIVRYCLMRAKELDSDWEAARYLSNDLSARLGESRHLVQNQNADSYPVVREVDAW